MKSVLTPLAKNVMLALGLSAGMPKELVRIKNEAKEEKRRISSNVIRNISYYYTRKCINIKMSNKCR